MYVDYDKLDHRTRVQNYLKAEEQLAQRDPKDDEALIAYAITLNVAASPTDKTYANQLKGAALLEPIFKRQPNHPGVAHYLIHRMTIRQSPRKASMRPSVMQRSRLPGHTHNTCHRISSPVWGSGTNRSPQIKNRPKSLNSMARRKIKRMGWTT